MKKTLALVLAVLTLTGSALAASEPTAPTGMYAEGDVLLIADSSQNVVLSRKGNELSTLAGIVNPKDIYGKSVGGYLDGNATTAQFNSPWDVVPFLKGYAVSDSGNNCLRYIANGKVTTLAGNGKVGFANGKSANARFHSPRGLAVDDGGTLYIADTLNHCIRSMNQTCEVSTFAGSTQAGDADGALTSARFGAPTGLFWYDGALYVTDVDNHSIRKIENGQVTTVSGNRSSTYENSTEPAGGYADGWAGTALFRNPCDVAVDAKGIYVADTGNSVVRKIDRDGWVSTVSFAGNQLNQPAGLAVNNGSIYVSDKFTGAIRSTKLTQSHETYTDVAANSWYADYVDFVTANNLFHGVSDTSFQPNGNMQRGMLAAVLARTAQVSNRDLIPSGKTTFSDVPSNAYYKDALAWAADHNVISGFRSGAFAPGNYATRQETVTMLYRLAKVLDLDVSASASLTTFQDSASVASWAKPAMSWAVAKGIVSGNKQGQLSPDAVVTRAQAAKLFSTFIKLS